MIRVSALHIYPLKSARGLSVERWPVDAFGLTGDRRFMVVDPQGAFMTQRHHPLMALLGVEFVGQDLRLSYPGRPSFVVKAPQPGCSQQVEIWGESVRGESAQGAA